jgi:hypothetical protein
MMKQIDTAVTTSAVLGLFLFVSMIYLLDLQGCIVVGVLLPVILGVVCWKVAYFVYTTMDKPSVIVEGA